MGFHLSGHGGEVVFGESRFQKEIAVDEGSGYPLQDGTG
jgi:hypothetical protein